ncbi:hypothetical protein Z517_02391 [Fonsecaea pedrosoi CBS 271.37]|uniref:Heterokaryon incompatibility domain-containing protein n=1 Tax=Fonsecaea pedrosoi CBS 271.37 TaxID=1442368 RepID=A0A0D2F934_9EURO|nr:uncharacterized protein Z517_02391 [Fonsecaea pedrosoi CBS 271.37]KIW83147.1 hypothetical protein Z517_02391 [Fonsecaea pedrosoi CBS 271.37]
MSLSSEISYKYEPLPAESIRLLCLQPGSESDHIACNLVTTRVEDGMSGFEALSYTWGDLTVTRAISCGGCSLAVHSNAWHALSELRQAQGVRVLWIDALCINQGDLAERNMQVQMMRETYGRATRVVVWLGRQMDNTDQVFALISKLSTMATVDNLDHQTVAYTHDDLEAGDLPDASDPVWRGLDQLLWSSWFSRVWIIQEITLAREALVFSGSASCGWHQLELAARFVEDHSLTMLVDVDPSQVIRLARLKALASRAETSILEILQQSRSSKSTDPRDKIFGLLGLTPSFTLIIPDYNMATHDLHTAFALKMMEAHQSLDILNYTEIWADYTLPAESLDKTPSWAPNWLLSGLTRPLPATAELNAGNRVIFHTSPDSSLLHVWGVELATVDGAGDTFLEWIPRPGNSVRGARPINWVTDAYQMKRWRQWQRMSGGTATHYPTGEATREAYIRTIVANALPDGAHDGCALQSYYDAWLRFWRVGGRERGRYLDAYIQQSDPGELQRAISFMEAHQAAAYGRRFLITKNGYFGLGPFKSRRGDVVVALCGGKTAYVLRRQGRRHFAKRTRTEYWKVIGECYLHGVDRDVILTRTNHKEYILI